MKRFLLIISAVLLPNVDVGENSNYSVIMVSNS